jgi:hypothetical protein
MAIINNTISTLNLTSNSISIQNSIELPEGVEPFASVNCRVNGVDKLVIFSSKEVYDEELDESFTEFPIFIVTLGSQLTISDPIINPDLSIIVYNDYKSFAVDSNYISFIGAFVKEINPNIAANRVIRKKNELKTGIMTIKINPNDTIEFGDITNELNFETYDIFEFLYLQELQFVDGKYLYIEPGYDDRLWSLPLNVEQSNIIEEYSIKLGIRNENKIEFFDPIESAIGIFESTVEEGEEVNVFVNGIYENDSFNLVPGKSYYSDTNGNLTTTKKIVEENSLSKSYLKIGKSLTSKKINLNIESENEKKENGFAIPKN